MNTHNITLDKQPLSTYGATLLDGSYISLMTPANLKSWVTNDAVDKDGIDYIQPTVTNVAERSVTLVFLISGENEADFIAKYNSFIGLLHKGMIELNVPDLKRTFNLKFEGCTPFDKWMLQSCKLSVKFTEPKPKNYSVTEEQ
ncbi:MAG: hypothetical protein J6U93_01460 [Alistipes sp.]|nr:hypothetical protein [Alistipes sp.]